MQRINRSISLLRPLVKSLSPHDKSALETHLQHLYVQVVVKKQELKRKEHFNVIFEDNLVLSKRTLEKS